MAKPKFEISALEEAPEELRSYYTKVDRAGKEPVFVLDVEGVLTPGEIRAAKAETKAHQEKVEALEAKLKSYSNIDPAKYEAGLTLLKNVEDVKERELLTAGKYEEVIQHRVTRLNASHKNEVDTYKTQLDDLTKKLALSQKAMGGLKLETELVAAVNASGVKVRKGAMADLSWRAQQRFHVDEEGKVFARDDQGGIIHGPKGAPMSMSEYVQELASTEAPYLFEPAVGGGATGSGTPGAGIPTVSKSDPLAMGRNAQAILDRKVRVVD